MKKHLTIFLIVLLLAVVVLAAVHLITRDTVPDGALAIYNGNKTAYLDISELELADVTGTIVNGKGIEKQIDAKGIALAEVLENAGISAAETGSVTVKADDEFSAVINSDELCADIAFIVIEDDDSMTLVVFGDDDSKRNVKNVVAVYAE